MKPSRSDIVVIGAGVAGLASALRLAKTGLRVTLVASDAQRVPPAPNAWDLRVFAISQSSKALFDEISVWSQLDLTRVEPVNAMSVFANGGDSVPVDFDATDIGDTELAWIAEQSNLLRALHAQIAESRIKVIASDVKAMQLDKDSVTLTLADDSALTTRLVVGADGANSPTRAMAGIAHRQSDYGQRALVGHLAVTTPHQSRAFQWFGDHGILALLPLPDLDGQHRMSMVWSCPSETAQENLGRGADHAVSEMAAIASTWVGRCTPLGELASFPLHRQVADSLIGERVALVGDAAHVVHPLAGQGLNLGLSDVAVLARLIDQARSARGGSRFDPGHSLLLSRYRRHRAEPLMVMQTAIDGLQRMFSHAGASGSNRSLFDAIPVTTRELGWDFVARNSYLRRQLIRLAER